MAATTVLIPDLVQGRAQSSALPMPAGKTGIEATGLLSDAAIADPTKRLTFTLLVSFDGGLTFNTAASASWVGGSLAINSPPPPATQIYVAPNVGADYAQSGYPPTHVAIQVDSPMVLSVGAQLDFN